MEQGRTHVATVLIEKRDEILATWLDELSRASTGGATPHDTHATTRFASELLQLMAETAQSAGDVRLGTDGWQPVRQFLDDTSANRARAGYSSAQTAVLVFSLKRALFDALRKRLSTDAQALADEIWNATQLVDEMGLHTVTAYQRSREEIILRQQEDMLELSTPVVKLWDGILALPMIGTLDSGRTQVVMESLLQRIVETGSEIAILDITGVPTVDTLVAQHLLKTVTAIRLMGGDCIISGVRPQIAQTIVHLGVNLEGITTKATLADALALALKRTGQAVVKVAPAITSPVAT